jgi:two-component system cell cycle sensor histidine kinase/response regulator CckA
MDELLLSRLGVGALEATPEGELVRIDQTASSLLQAAVGDRPAWLASVAARLLQTGGTLEEAVPELGVTIVARAERDSITALICGHERKVRGLLDRVPDGVLLQSGGRVVYANPRAAALLGASGPEAMLGTELAPELTAGREGELADVCLSSDRVVEVAWLTLSSHGRDTVLVMMRDITVRRLLQARLAQSDRLAAVGMLAAGVAHEVNNPLTYVMHYLDRLAHELSGLGGLDSSTREGRTDLARRTSHLAEGARAALEGSLRVREIVRDLKTFGRTEEGPSVPIDVNRVVRSAVQMGGHHIRSRARLETDLRALPVVRASDGRLCQVLLNLLLNAAQAIPEGAAQEHCVSVHSWAQDGLVCIAVSDTGCGIEGKNLARLFDPFFTTKSDRGGSGLGLWISRELVHEIGGHIEVESEPGRGSTFTVVLPVAVGDEAYRVVSSAPPPAVFERRGRPAQLHRVLVVDDEPALRDLLAEALSDRAQVLTASNGLEAREVLEHDDRFDLVLCDLVMPGMTGMELFEWVERSQPGLAPRFVFMTGAAFTAHMRELLDRVANQCLNKPFRVRDVEHVIDRFVRPPSA